ncbi:map/microtubule affinity-regulating kinase [Anaeramoeba flamelloides]|uniref:Map/microtubule affinity-regulating kinase n=1 Tax=Anaeramoeba flamelloides TaxID=1746091 RepID=A0AAV8A0N0_9EUKA|nr:map/microtubule affinity-regulating kinase [Anaeramoeba flamelloides]
MTNSFLETEREPKRKTFDEIYEIFETIGYGSNSKVKFGVHKEKGEKVAIKIISRKKFKIDSHLGFLFKREKEILKRLEHRNIVQFCAAYQSKNNYYLITKYIKGWELLEVINHTGKLSEFTAFKIWSQIVKAIGYCHSQDIVHRDIKPENIIVNKMYKIKIIDFGISNFVRKNELLSTNCGSPLYTAPEVWKGKHYNGKKADIWSLGIVLYLLVCGKPPFYEHNNILPNNITYPLGLSESLVSLIKRTLSFYPMKRPSCKKILKHKWLTENTKLEKILESEIIELPKTNNFKNIKHKLNINDISNHENDMTKPKIKKETSNEIQSSTINNLSDIVNESSTESSTESSNKTKIIRKNEIEFEKDYNLNEKEILKEKKSDLSTSDEVSYMEMEREKEHNKKKNKKKTTKKKKNNKKRKKNKKKKRVKKK